MALFNSIKGLQPKRHFFDLSFDKKFTCDMGQLIPIMCEECVPGDNFKLSIESVIRFQPMMAPILHEINVNVEYFFVPTRLLFDNWENFITGGKEGTYTATLPLWDDYKTTAAPKYSLWDYMSFPLVKMVSDDNCPLDFGRAAYNLVWNTYYRDETIDDEIDLKNNNILYRRWKKDYFTSALPFRQRGGDVNLPLSGNAPIVWSNYSDSSLPSNYFGPTQTNVLYRGSLSDVNSPYGFGPNYAFTNDNLSSGQGVGARVLSRSFSSSNSASFIYGQEADLSSVSASSISDLRLAFQLQKWLERNARAGYRYPEFTLAHFGVSPSDARLQRPEFIGGTKSPLLVSEVLQTSQTTSTSPQGNLAGRGIGVLGDYCGKFIAPEFGYIIGLFSIMPKGGYMSQGVNKKWLRRSKMDFYFPEFSHLSEQPVKRRELFVDSTNDTNNGKTFGYQGIYDELRHNTNQVCADMRDTFKYWHLNRYFTESPALNSDFLTCNPSKRIFAVENEPGFIVDVGNIVKAVRPIPKYADPGFLDHF